MFLGVGNAWGAEYNLVTDASTLSSGDVILIVTEGRSVTTKISGTNYTATYNDQAMNTTASNNHLLSGDVSISSSSITSTTATEFTLSGNSSAWKIHNGNNYLYTTERNKLSTNTEANGLTFTIAIDPSTYAATIQTTKSDFAINNQGGQGPLIIKFHAASTNQSLPSIYYALYAASMTTEVYDVFIYKKAASCSNSVTVTSGTLSTNGSISTITGSPVATCDATASNRTVTITVSPNTGYVAPSELSFSVTSGNSVTATRQSGPTNNVYVYSFAQNDNNSTCKVNVACVGKQCTLIFNQNGGEGGQTSNLTATYGSAMPAISGVPTRDHYDFDGYYDGAGGTGNKYYNSDGTSAINWNKNTTANTTLYAKWTEHSLTNYRTVCCTELGVITGGATLTQGGNSVTISGWSTVSNVGTYTVKMYKKNGANWDLVSGSAANGDAGAQGTRTGITSGSKSVTYTGLEVESEYKFTVQAIAGSSAYCDGVETAVTEINDVDVSSTPFKFRYAIYIDDGTNANYEYYYIEPTGNTDEGSVDIDLSAHVDYYQFKIAGGFSGWWGQGTPQSKIPANTEWTLNGAENVWLNTGAGGTYTFTVDYSSTNPAVTVTFPSADQGLGYKIYFDKSGVDGWGNTLKYRIGNNTHNQNQNFTLVTGTDNFYVTTTPSYGSMDAWQIANNVAWSGSNSIYNYYHGDDNDITKATVYLDYAVDEDITIVPTSKKNTENSCDFWYVDKTSGMLTHTATITTPSHGTITISYNDESHPTTPDSKTVTTAGLAHRTILTITAAPDAGYSLTSLTVDGNAHTSGDTIHLRSDIVIAATFTANTTTAYTVKHYKQKLDGTYNASPDETDNLTGTTDASVTPDRKSYEGFAAPAGQTVTILGDGTRVVEYQYTRNCYDLTWVLNGGKVTTAGTHAAVDATGSPSGSVLYEAAITAPIVEKTGYNMTWSSTPASTMPAANTTYTANWSANNYTITLDNEGADSGHEGTGSISVTYDANTNLDGTPAITKPVKDGYLFGGYFVGDDGTGTQIIDGDGNVIASVPSYTSATKQWIYDGSITLHAKWSQIYTVTWYVNENEWTSGTVTGNTQVPSGTKVSALPTAPTSSDCDDSKVFVGWKAAEISGVSETNPGGIFTTQETSPDITGKTDFYAVFADESGGGFTRVKSTSQLAANKEIIMGYEGTPNSGVIVPVQSGTYDSNKYLLYTGTTSGSAGYATIDMSSITYENAANYIFTLKAGYNSGYWAFEMSGDNAGYYIGHKGRNVIDKHEGIQNDGKTDFAISFGTNDTASIVNKYGTENTTSWTSSGNTKYGYFKYLSYNYNTGTPRVSIYQTTQTGALVLYIANPLTQSNYVTTCASCGADATFTDTTPAVSEIGCTGATLTATGGLATLGADGCNVSDYGFVIGTTNDPAPAIGGSGVTKLQVGTSNPTTGADFSYDATGLTKGTHYYIRAYATNRHGTAYSSSTNFWTNNVSSIAITTAPTKTNYIVGETFDATGMVVTATMASGATEDVTSDVTYSDDALTAGTDKAFAINYSLCETAVSTSQTINVYTLTVNEGTNPEYGTATNSSANIVSISGLGDHKTYTVTVTSSNATAVDNGDNTWSIINPTGNVTVRVDYADAVQVKVYYKVDGVTVTDLTQDVYQSETTTLPTASELATAMTAQGMEIPDDDYPNFVGWSETEFGAQTSEPTLVTGTPTINAEKTYYAVYTNLSKKQILPSDFGGSYATNEGAKTIDGLGYNIHDICLQSSKIQFKNTPGYLYSTSALSYIKKIEITGLDLIVNACLDNAGTLDGDAITPTGSGTYVYTFPASKQYFKIKGKGGTDKVSLIEIFYASSTVYYMTQFCTNRVTLTQNSPEHGTVEFGRSSLVTCGSDKNVSLTIIPDVGYQLTGWTVNTSSGYADAKTTSPAVVTNSNNSAAQNITLTFAEDANKDYDVTATFGLMTVTSWAWTVNSAAIPDPLNLYIGQSARLDVAYTPAGVDNSKKTYERTKVDTYINWVGVAQSTYTTISGRASTGENTTPVTFTHGDGPTTTVNVKVLPLPLVHFGDIVHNVSFDDVVATLSDNTLSPTKTTPTHADFDGSTANTCEEQHLHLVGWIREDWPALVTYLNGGAQPSTSDITTAGDDASGNAYFFEPGASINTQTFNGVTFYAVWAKVE